jgi:phage terminase large subunit-like protein
MYWLPEEAINKWEDEGKRQGRDNVPYKLWETQGFIRTCNGNKCDKRIFLDWFRELQEQGLYALFIGYDPWHIDDTLLREFKADFGENAMITSQAGNNKFIRADEKYESRLTGEENNLQWKSDRQMEFCQYEYENRRKRKHSACKGFRPKTKN